MEKSHYWNKVKENFQACCKYPYIIDDGHDVIMLKRTDEGELIVADTISKSIRVISVNTDITTKEKTCILRYITLSGQEEIEVKNEILANKNQIVSLSKYGVDVTSINSNKVIKHLNNEMTKVKKFRKITQNLGFIFNGKKTVFVGANSLTKKDKKICKASITYFGDINLSQSGDRCVYEEMLRKDVFTSIPLSTIFSIALSAPLVAYIGKDVNVKNIVTHVSGDSSTGKSTALKLGISAFSSIANEEEKTSLFASWNTTENALIEMISGNYGVPVALDEIGMFRGQNYSGIIYKLAEGKEKMRLNFGEGNNSVREWSTSILSSGENPLEDDSDRASGIGIRLISFNGIKLTENADHSERILEVIEKNYGFFGEEFVKKVLKSNKEKLILVHKKEVEKLDGLLRCGKFNVRIANTLSIIILVAKIIEKMGFELDIEAIRNFLIENANETKGSANSLAERALEVVKSEITKHQNSIEKRSRNGQPLYPVFGEVWGVAYCEEIGKNVHTYEVALQIQTCDEILKTHGFKNPKEVYRQWLDKGFITKNSKGNYRHKTKIGGIDNANTIKIIMEED